MPAKREKVHFESVDELLGAPSIKEGTEEIRIDRIHPFAHHPFKVQDDSAMKELTESIRANGVLVPVLVRPQGSSYEMISGHRRMHAASLAGLTSIPAVIREMSDDDATIAMVDANMQREEVLPSERAYSLKMKLDAIRRQGQKFDDACGTEFHKSDNEESFKGNQKSRDIVGAKAGLSGRQVTKYIRLTELIPELLDLVDQKQLSLTMGVDISYFDKDLQKWLLSYIRKNGRLHQLQLDTLKGTNSDNLTEYTMKKLLDDALPRKTVNKLTLTRKKLDRYFANSVPMEKREAVILDLLDQWKKRQEG